MHLPPNDAGATPNVTYSTAQLARSEINDELSKKLLDLIDKSESFEGNLEVVSDDIQDINDMLERIANSTGVNKWDKFFNVIDGLNLLNPLIRNKLYYFMSYFRVCKDLGIIETEQEENELLMRYLRNYGFLD